MNELNEKLKKYRENEGNFPNYKELVEISQKIDKDIFYEGFKEGLQLQGLTDQEIKERWIIWNKKQNNIQNNV